MKKQLCTIALSGLFALGIPALSAAAQDTMQPQGGAMQQGGGMHHGMSADDQLAHMTKRYKLTSDQQSQIKPILEAQQQSMMQMHSDTSMSREDKMAKMQSMREDNKTKIEAVLNDDQKKKYEADQARMQQRRQDHMGNGGNMGGSGDNAPPPPPQ
jgi:protein CpxP